MCIRDRRHQVHPLLAVRLDAPRSPADGGARGYLQGDALAQWLQQLQAAWAAVPQRAA